MTVSARETVIKIAAQVKAAAIQACMNASDDIQSTSRDTVRSWKHKVGFGETVVNGQRRIEFTVKPTGSRANLAIFGYIDRGTKGPYKIPKVVVPGKVLTFKTGYSARTQPVARYNVGSGQSFGNFVSKKQVTHPGIRARKFMENSLDKLTPPLVTRVNNEIKLSLAK